jgi:hypothetical protein
MASKTDKKPIPHREKQITELIIVLFNIFFTVGAKMMCFIKSISIKKREKLITIFSINKADEGAIE